MNILVILLEKKINIKMKTWKTTQICHANSPARSLDGLSNLPVHTGNYTSLSANLIFQAVKTTTTINNVQYFQLKLLNILIILLNMYAK